MKALQLQQVPWKIALHYNCYSELLQVIEGEVATCSLTVQHIDQSMLIVNVATINRKPNLPACANTHVDPVPYILRITRD